jgi:hypothetical protein
MRPSTGASSRASAGVRADLPDPVERQRQQVPERPGRCQFGDDVAVEGTDAGLAAPSQEPDKPHNTPPGKIA